MNVEEQNAIAPSPMLFHYIFNSNTPPKCRVEYCVDRSNVYVPAHIISKESSPSINPQRSSFSPYTSPPLGWLPSMVGLTLSEVSRGEDFETVVILLKTEWSDTTKRVSFGWLQRVVEKAAAEDSAKSYGNVGRNGLYACLTQGDDYTPAHDVVIDACKLPWQSGSWICSLDGQRRSVLPQIVGLLES